jgi:hypothetical protein
MAVDEELSSTAGRYGNQPVASGSTPLNPSSAKSNSSTKASITRTGLSSPIPSSRHSGKRGALRAIHALDETLHPIPRSSCGIHTAPAISSRAFSNSQGQERTRFSGEGTRPSISSAVSALRFPFIVTLERLDLARRLTVVRQPRKLPLVLSAQEVALLLEAAP